MDNFRVSLNQEELDKETKLGKGIDCDYWMAMCTIGGVFNFDCGTCGWVYEHCTGYKPPNPGGGNGHGCTGH